eukprot:SAG11_NODE_8812_length_973_cov_13.344394_1_plen_66_part_00
MNTRIQREKQTLSRTANLLYARFCPPWLAERPSARVRTPPASLHVAGDSVVVRHVAPSLRLCQTQ